MKISSGFREIVHYFRIITRDKYSLYLLSILVAGAFLRLYGIGKEDLWLDEVRTVWFASEGQDLATVLRRILTDLQGPLYFIIIHFWTYISEVTESSIRTPSAIFGILSIFFIYILTVNLYSKRVALYSALLMAFSCVNFNFSQEARTYSFSTLLTIFSFYYFLKVLEKQNRYNTGLYIIFTVLLVYSHYFYLLILLPQTVYYLIHKGKDLNLIQLTCWGLIQILILICLIPAFYIFLEYQVETQGISRGNYVNYLTIFQIFKYLSGSSFLFLIFSGLLILSFSSHPLITKSQYKSLRIPKNIFLFVIDRKKIFLCAWLLLPVVTAVLVGVFYKTTFFPRYFIVCTPALFILVALGIDNIRYSSLQITILITIVLLSLIVIFNNYNQTDKTEWKKIVQTVEDGYKKNDIVIFYPGYLISPFNYYSETGFFPKKFSYTPENTVINQLKLWKHPPSINDKLIGEMNSEKYNNIWFIQSSRDDKSVKLKNIFSNNRNFVYTKRMSDNANVYLSLYLKENAEK